jgi:hypothetical protein
MPIQISRANSLYGFPGPLNDEPLSVISLNRAPTSADQGQIGQFILNTATATLYICTATGASGYIWTALETNGGIGGFISLAVVGPTTLTGTTNINTTGSAVTSIGTGGTGATHIGNATGNTQVTGSLTASTSLTATAGNVTITDGNLVLSTAATYISLPGPVFIYSGSGAPSAGLALHVGDMYINTTAASATTRLYIATAASTWTNVTCAA